MTLRAIPALALGCAAALAAAEGERPEVEVDRYRLEPLARFEFADDHINLHPWALALVGYDSNVYQSPDDEVDDSFQALAAGLDARWDTPGGTSGELRGQIRGRNYTEEDDRDLISGRGELALQRQRDVWVADLDLSYEHVDDPLLETGRRLRRQRFDGRAGLQLRRPVHTYGATVGGERLDYLEDGATFSAEDRDRWNADLGVWASYRPTEDDSFTLDLRADLTTYDSDDTPFQGGRGGDVMIRYGRRRSRTGLVAGIGVTWRQFDDDYAGDPSYDDEQVLAPLGLLELGYRPSDRMELTIGMEADLVGGASSNAAWIYDGQLEHRWRIGQRWSLVSGLGYTWRRDSGAAAGEDARTSGRTDIRTALQRMIGDDGAALGAEVGYVAYRQNGFRDDYDQIVATVSGVVAF